MKEELKRKITLDDIREAVESLKQSCPCKGKHPDDFIGTCIHCGFTRLQPMQQKVLKEIRDEMMNVGHYSDESKIEEFDGVKVLTTKKNNSLRHKEC